VEALKKYQQQTLLVIPVYNHGATLTSVVNQAKKAGWDILVVDDGSDQPLEAVKLGCNVLHHKKNCGKGAAILTGAIYAQNNSYPYILSLDADGQHDPHEAVKLLAEVKANQPKLIIGARDMTGANIPKASIFGMNFSNFWVRLETNLSLPDTQSGMRLYPVRELLSLSFTTSHYDFEIESLVRLAWAGIPIKSVNIQVTYPEKGKRISHFRQFTDNFRLSVLHTKLVLRSLWPVGHKQLTAKKKTSPSLFHPIKLLKQLLSEHATPLQIATAVWVGIFLGTVPLIALHTAVIIYTTHKLHLNKVAAVTASQLCMPPLVPFLCIQTGYYFFNGSFLYKFSKETLIAQAGDRLLEYLIGSFIVGPLLAFIVAGICYVTAQQVYNFKEKIS
jgi:glycosyltransferase involved in cell wall biosynthesis